MERTGKQVKSNAPTIVELEQLKAKEILGEWEEVRIIETKEEFYKLSEEEVESILSSAYKKHKFDMEHRKS